MCLYCSIMCTNQRSWNWKPGGWKEDSQLLLPATQKFSLCKWFDSTAGHCHKLAQGNCTYTPRWFIANATYGTECAVMWLLFFWPPPPFFFWVLKTWLPVAGVAQSLNILDHIGFSFLMLVLIFLFYISGLFALPAILCQPQHPRVTSFSACGQQLPLLAAGRKGVAESMQLPAWKL